eukprot:TRINITY_DN3924_c0_g1_i17.p1 TRINITY_DN3924_c0_g1~~TRINITY_DN3924_c0_g1_i17.p1  ORF type:complete len:107 (+),score=25.75 TRINITY_DN3924_c0_g1_i17:197-517(+)
MSDVEYSKMGQVSVDAMTETSFASPCYEKKGGETKALSRGCAEAESDTAKSSHKDFAQKGSLEMGSPVNFGIAESCTQTVEQAFDPMVDLSCGRTSAVRDLPLIKQ